MHLHLAEGQINQLPVNRAGGLNHLRPIFYLERRSNTAKIALGGRGCSSPMRNRELVRLFVRGSVHTPNTLWMQGDVLYSYALPIAKRRTSRGMVLMTTPWASVTTQRHRGLVRALAQEEGVPFLEIDSLCVT